MEDHQPQWRQDHLSAQPKVTVELWDPATAICDSRTRSDQQLHRRSNSRLPRLRRTSNMDPNNPKQSADGKTGAIVRLVLVNLAKGQLPGLRRHLHLNHLPVLIRTSSVLPTLARESRRQARPLQFYTNDTLSIHYNI